MAQAKQSGTEQIASAKGSSLPISTKASIEISNYLRFRSTKFAKQFLADVIVKKQAVPFKKFNRDMGHKVGMMAGRYPIKAATSFLHLIKSAESNAQAKGLNTGSLKIIKLLANKASAPAGGGRHRQGTKRSHLEIQVKEMSVKKKDKKPGKKSQSKVESPKTEVKKEEVKVAPETPKVEEKTEEPKVEEIKSEAPVVEEKVEEPTPEPVAEPEVETPAPKPVEEVKPAEQLPQETPNQEADSKAEEMKQAALAMEQKLKEPVVTAADLLKEAQIKASELNVQQKKDAENLAETQKAEKLFEQLQKKGTLRDGDEQ
ncbi:50S ribosomal protein L22 [Candidatus Woesearchaeota archaeon]|jgi:large subunit ribosomal protein L22|nr:50S ribosomal protein L22 [Candidatus Woesearchaeota archaeon]MBT4151274.1 50S ribosomal protein L22 [Candidatus Woesearchaeota archaeon]MBT4433966.1 50S ribosomal protein L22 [Candidatus Woesearchaeota archaeon]MBT7332363.1 50S ribosomal protein L22 [Candidatus Woesearchaeota archaeon]